MDLSVEQLLSFADAARGLPRRRGGKRPHVATLYRWSTSGCRGVVLETIQIGATRCTSAEALARFFGRLTVESRGVRPEPAAPTRKSLGRGSWVDADAELDREGL